MLLSSLWLYLVGVVYISATSLAFESTDQIILFLKAFGEIHVQSQYRILLEASLALKFTLSDQL